MGTNAEEDLASSGDLDVARGGLSFSNDLHHWILEDPISAPPTPEKFSSSYDDFSRGGHVLLPLMKEAKLLASSR